MGIPGDVTVIIPVTDRFFADLAERFAAPSAVALQAVDAEVYVSWGPTVAEARNSGLRAAQGAWTVFLDADDTLPPDYLSAVPDDALEADVIATRIQYYRGSNPWGGGGIARRAFGGPAFPTVWSHEHQCEPECLTAGNWIHVGAIVSTDLAQKLGGFREWAWSEDWDFWLRAHLGGARFARSPDSIYRAWRRPGGSRNRSLTSEDHNRIHHEILASNGLA